MGVVCLQALDGEGNSGAESVNCESITPPQPTSERGNGLSPAMPATALQGCSCEPGGAPGGPRGEGSRAARVEGEPGPGTPGERSEAGGGRDN